jgi:hypothetical protein
MQEKDLTTVLLPGILQGNTQPEAETSDLVGVHYHATYKSSDATSCLPALLIRHNLQNGFSDGREDGASLAAGAAAEKHTAGR